MKQLSIEAHAHPSFYQLGGNMKINNTIYFAFINFSDNPETIPPYTQYKELEAYCHNLGVEMF